MDDEFIARLNREFRGVSDPTDVLSFPQGPAEFRQVGPRLLGDLVISTETAQRQAKGMGHSLREEMDILLTHGILHLLGFEHEASRYKARKMKAREVEVLAALSGS